MNIDLDDLRAEAQAAGRARPLRHPLRRLRAAGRRRRRHRRRARPAALRGLRARAVLAHPDGQAARQLRRRHLLLPLQDAAGAARRPLARRRASPSPTSARRRCSRRCTTSPAWRWRTSSCTRRRSAAPSARPRAPPRTPPSTRRSPPSRPAPCTSSPHELELGASKLVEHLLPRFDAEMVVVRRRRNLRRLAAALDGLVEVVGDPLPPGACPLFLPVRLVDRDKRAIVQALHARGIDAIDFWGDRRQLRRRVPRGRRAAPRRSSSSPAINPSTTTRSTWWHMP